MERYKSRLNKLTVNKYQSNKGILAIALYWALETFYTYNYIYLRIFLKEFKLNRFVKYYYIKTERKMKSK